jgi:signal transduction histidine kinase
MRSCHQIILLLLFLFSIVFSVFGQSESNKLQHEYDSLKVEIRNLFTINTNYERLLTVLLKYKTSKDKEVAFTSKVIAIIIKCQQLKTSEADSLLKKLIREIDLPDKKKNIWIHTTQGMIFHRMQELKKAEISFESVFSEKTDFIDIIDIRAFALRTYSQVLSMEGCYDKALIYISLSEELYKQINCQKELAVINKFTGRIYEATDKDSLALTYYSKALHHLKNQDDKEELAWMYTVIANFALNKIKKPELSKQYQDSCFQLMKNTKEYRLISICYNNFGEIEQFHKNYKNAGKYFQLALDTLNQLSANNMSMDFRLQMAIWSNIANTYLQMKDYPKAISYYDMIILAAKHQGRNNEIAKACKIISQIKIETGDFKGALDFYKESTRYDSIVRNNERMKIIEEYVKKFELTEKENTILKLSLDSQKKDALLKIERFKQILMLLFVGFSFLFIILFWQYLKRKGKIKEKDHRILSLQMYYKGQEEERKRFAKELHDGVAANIFAACLQLNDFYINRRTDDSINNMLQLMEQTREEVRNISRNLYSPFFENATIVEVLETLKERFNEKNGVEIQLILAPQNYQWETFHVEKQQEIYRIVQELVVNSMNHGKPKTISVHLIVRDNDLSLIVEDDGLGFDLTSAKNGIGLKTVKDRIEILSGTLNIDSRIGEGTAINITIPY